jgi:hypothetical protein
VTSKVPLSEHVPCCPINVTVKAVEQSELADTSIEFPLFAPRIFALPEGVTLQIGLITLGGAMYVIVEPGQTVVGPVNEKNGLALIETVNGIPAPVHERLELRRTNVPLYVPEGAVPGTVRLIAPDVKLANGLTLAKPALKAALS